MPLADLHIHSTSSDGLLSPREIVEKARSLNLHVIAVTDHDTVDGVEEALAAGRELAVHVLPGIELSTESHGEEIHVLGYLIDYHSADLHRVLSELKQARVDRIRKIIQLLNNFGFIITWEEVTAAGGTSLGRPHIARLMVEKGYASSIREVFSKWIGPGRPAYVQRYKLTPPQAIEIIHACNGLAFLAHPGLLKNGIEVIKSLIPFGLDGIEVFHSEHSEAQSRELIACANNEGKYVCGGSDCHGNPGELKMGHVTINTKLIAPWLKD